MIFHPLTPTLMKICTRLAGAVCMLLLAGYLAYGLQYASYTPNRSATFLWGVYHVHSTMSDGLQSAEEIARQARAAGVSLVLLTDHGDPNLKSNTFRRVIEGVVVVGGSEVRLPAGRLTFFGMREAPQFPLSSFPPAAIEDIREWGGFPILAYPEDARYGWQYWNGDLNPGGIEILNLFTSLRSSPILDKIRLALYYPFSHYYFLRNISYPKESIAHWDEFLRTGKTWGLAATDAHGGFRMGWLTAQVPSYADAFSFAGLGIDKRYAAEPEAAVRRGDFFNCIRGAGEPDAFEFYATFAKEQFRSGSIVPLGSELHARLQIRNHVGRLVLKKDGVAMRGISGAAVDVADAERGAYRVEVYLEGHEFLPPNVPWIVSNPILIGLPWLKSRVARVSSRAHAQILQRPDS